MAESKKHAFLTTLSIQRRADLSSSGTPVFGPAVWLPPIDVYETTREFIVIAEIGGVAAEDVEIELRGQTLRISGERTALVGDLGPGLRCIHHREIDHGAFEREVTLPVAVDPSCLAAQLDAGVLRVILTKSDAPPKRDLRSIKVE